MFEKRTIVIIAFCILVVYFVFIVFFMKQTNSDVVFPPVVSRCPDYWDHDRSGVGGDGVCKNTFGMKKDNVKIPDQDFSKYDNGSSGKCSKKKWALTNRVMWDGVTNDTQTDCSEY